MSRQSGRFRVDRTRVDNRWRVGDSRHRPPVLRPALAVPEAKPSCRSRGGDVGQPSDPTFPRRTRDALRQGELYAPPVTFPQGVLWAAAPNPRGTLANGARQGRFCSRTASAGAARTQVDAEDGGVGSTPRVNIAPRRPDAARRSGRGSPGAARGGPPPPPSGRPGSGHARRPSHRSSPPSPAGSARERLAPMQKCSPCPKPMLRLAFELRGVHQEPSGRRHAELLGCARPRAGVQTTREPVEGQYPR